MRKLSEGDEKQEVEVLKAVAQAWHAHAGDANPTNEFDARRSAAARSPLRRPSRFKLEAKAKAKAKASSSWDFSRSLCDSYEIVSISKQIEACTLAFDQPMPTKRKGKRRVESKNSLRSLFGKASSRRFDARRDIPGVLGE